MNLSKLKSYAPHARLAFVSAMTDRATLFGVTAHKAEPVVDAGAVVMIGGHQHPRSVIQQRYELDKLVQQLGFSQTMEVLAYTWFNRLLALRFMELHGYLDHGYRVLSHPEGKATPEVMEHAEHLSLPGLDPQRVIELKLDGTKDSELYRLLLIAQCNALHATLPFLFGRVDDLSELFLPDNLLHSDSILRKLVSEIPEDDWSSVEILGWLYQFYISDRKDEVMARKSAVPTEDIPAVTQLFTPHWIVRYLVENSLGRLWLLNRPGSSLREHMPYYIEGEAETEFLRISKPEEIRLLDPAVGSGHMLTYAFDLLYLIYQEEGYVPNEIPALILRHNLHGLEICPRAAQLAQLALVLKARDKSRRFFQPSQIVQPCILALQNICFSERELETYFEALGSSPSDLNPQLPTLLGQFENATTFGSLIQPCMKELEISAVRTALDAKNLGSQLLLRDTHQKIRRVLEQAEMLCQRYQVVVANPPYMGGGLLNIALKRLALGTYPKGKADLFAMFIERCLLLVLDRGFVAMVTMQTWMFISSFEKLREQLLSTASVRTMAHLGARAFSTISGEIVQTTAFVLTNGAAPERNGVYFRLTDYNSEIEKNKALLERKNLFHATPDQIAKIPGRPLAYWVSSRVRELFATEQLLGDIAPPRKGMITSDNKRFLRVWTEVELNRVGFGIRSRKEAKSSGKKWFPYNKGGEARKWFGNKEHLVNWEDDGAEVIGYNAKLYGSASRQIQNTNFYFLPSVSWSWVSSSIFGARYYDAGFIFDTAGPSISAEYEVQLHVLALLTTPLAVDFVAALNPTLNFVIGTLSQVPVVKLSEEIGRLVIGIAEQAIGVSRQDWDNFETSWDFRDLPLLREGTKGATIAESWRNWEAQSLAAIRRMQELETENNRLFIGKRPSTPIFPPPPPRLRLLPKREESCFHSKSRGSQTRS